jgi:type 1 fimbria pilin
MKKYITLITGILLTTDICAESYIYNGKAQFLGVLVNPSCSVLIRNPASIFIEPSKSPIQIHFSTCSIDYYKNITVSLSEQNKLKKEIFHTDIQVKNNLNKKTNTQSNESISFDQNFIRRIDQPQYNPNDSNQDIHVFLNKPAKFLSIQAAPLILISISYP